MALRSGAAASPVDRMSAMGPGIAGSQMPSSLHQQHHQHQAQQQHQGVMQHSQSPSSGSAQAQARRTQKPELSGAPADQFPIGLRVLVVDDDMCCLRVVDKMLKLCGYQVTTCPLATTALELLRTNKDAFDLVISDVHMPDMDGFKLLELVGLEMDLPVIMMSANGETAQVMKGITHGACDYLLKPVRQAELSNIWQHVVRKKRNENKDAEQSSLEDERHKKGADDGDLTSCVNDTSDGNWKLSKKRKDAKEEDDDNEQDNDDPSTLKKPRVVWSVELHQQFVSAVNKLGIDKAVPKRILELMSVHGLTRENVASHLQKYRLYLKRLSGVTHPQGSPYGGPADPFGSMAALDGVGELRALAAAGQLTPQALAALQANVLGRMNPGPNGMGLGGLDSSMLLHMSQGGNAGLMPRRVPQHLLNMHMQGMPNALDLDPLCQPQQIAMGLGGQAPLEDVAGLTAALQHQLATAGGLSGMGTGGGMNGSMPPNPNNNALMMQLLQHQQHQQQQQLQNSHAEVGANVSLQGGGLLGQHMLPSDLNLGRAGPLPSMTAVNACLGDGSGLPSLAGSRGLGVPPINTGCAMSNTLSGLVRPSIEGKLGGGQQPFPCVSSVPSSPVGLVSPSAMKDLNGGLGSITDCLTSKPVVRGNTGTNFTPLGNLSRGLGQSLNSNSRPNWQSHGPSLGGPDFSQPLSPVMNGPHQRYGQMNAPAQELNTGYVRGQGFMGQGVPYSGRLSVDTSGAISLSEQSTADSDMKLKDERPVDSIFSTKLDGGLMAHRDDDLLGMFMEQVSRAPLF